MPSKEEEGKLKEFFHDEIKDIYWAEKKLVQTLPKLAKPPLRKSCAPHSPAISMKRKNM